MRTKECQLIRLMLVDHVDNTLDAADRQAVQAHLATCLECAAEYELQRATNNGLHSLQAPNPGAAFWDAFPDQILRAYKTEHATRPAFGARLRHTFETWLNALQPRVLAPVAAAVLVAVGATLFLAREPALSPGLAFQAQLSSQQNLATLLSGRTSATTEDATFGFAGGGSANLFRAGHAYAEMLAYNAGGDRAATQLRLAVIAKVARQAGHEGEPLATQAEVLAQRTEMNTRDLGKLEAGLSALAVTPGERDPALFQSGLWLVNAQLALAADNTSARRVAARELTRQLPRLESSGVAAGAVRALHDLTALLARETLTAHDLDTARALVRRIEAVLL